jgi:hypothetical protein
MSLQAYNFVCLLLHCSKAVGRGDGYCEDDRLAQPGGPQRRACCRAGSNAIVDHNCGTTSDLLLARKEGKRVKLYSRPGNDLTYRFPLIVEAIAKLPPRSCTIDGEAVACGPD